MNNKNDLSHDHARLDLTAMTNTAIIATAKSKDEIYERYVEIRNSLTDWYHAMNKNDSDKEATLLIHLTHEAEYLMNATKDLHTALDMLQTLRGANYRSEIEVVKS